MIDARRFHPWEGGEGKVPAQYQLARVELVKACLKAGVNYLDTANYEPKDEAHFEYSWQWAYKQRFEEAGLTAILVAVSIRV